MGVFRTTESRPINSPVHHNFLRPGQVVKGRVLKLYPHQRAQIQIGSLQMTAKLEASLSIGTNYYFQVERADDLIHLRLISDALSSDTKANAMNLLKQLGLKAGKQEMLLLQSLIDEQIPFRTDQLKNAFTLMAEGKNKSQARFILKDMLANNLPVTESVFKALYAKETTSLTEQMRELLKQLGQDTDRSSLKQQLISQLGRLLHNPRNDRRVYHVLKLFGVIETQTTFSAWSLHHQHHLLETIDITAMMNKLAFFSDHESLPTAARNIWQTYSDSVHQTLQNNVPLTDQVFNRLEQDIRQKLIPLLPDDQKLRIDNTPQALRQLFEQLEALADKSTYTKAAQLLANFHRSSLDAQMKQLVQLVGFTDEYDIAHNQIQSKPNTLKSLLLQLIQHHDGKIIETSARLLHVINGLQLQSIQETNHMIFASIQLPGDKLGIQSDAKLELQGKKTDEGKLDLNHCRILFFLDLAHLKETMIDMHIQKRNVSIVILNDRTDLKQQAIPLKPMLEQGLDKLGYQLSSVTFKPYQQGDEQPLVPVSDKGAIIQQGVDYRI
ncbi:MAG TPA: hypothetical protein VK136_01445 [Bacillota bacterium]|nr:hypothetical protein [Bacillota bacterium]